MQFLPVCDAKMPSIMVKQIMREFYDDVKTDIKSIVIEFLQDCHAVVVDEKEVVFSYYNQTQSFRNKMIDKLIHRELIEESIHVLLTHKIIDIYMKYDESDSWRVRISDDKVSYFCMEYK